MKREPPADELAQRLEIALVPEELAIAPVLAVVLFLAVGAIVAVALDDAAEAGADRIDEHQIAEREPRLLVRDEPGRQLGQRSVRRKRDP